MSANRIARSKPLADLLACLVAALALALACALVGCDVADEEEEPLVYEYRYGTIEEHSMYDRSAILKDSYRYCDQWFFENPKERNDELALMSMQLVAAAAGNDADGRGERALADLGFEEVGFEPFHDDDQGDVAYVWGKKTIQAGSKKYTLVAVVIQAYSTKASQSKQSWLGNVMANGDGADASGEHYGWAHAADAILDGVAALGEAGEGESAQVKYWICGQSRGGAVTNILATRLLGRLGSRNAGIYAYAFEPPQTVDAGIDNARYGFIHNYVCSDDIVCMIPPWDMTRYGVEHEIKAETDAGIHDELEKLGSGAADVETEEYEEQTRRFVKRLAEIVPTREDYSAPHTASFYDENGNDVTFAYSFQEAFQHFVDFAYGGELGDITAVSLLKNISSLYSYARAINKAADLDEAGQMDAAAPYYWTAAKSLRSILLSISPKGSLSLTDTDIYVMLTLLGPTVTEADESDDSDDSGILSEIYSYLAPLTNFVTSAQPMIYSHYYDTLIARLKVLAPLPELEDINIEIDEPAAGDAAATAPECVAAYIEGLGYDWLTAEAQWLDAGSKLKDDTAYELSVTLRAVGHEASDELALTLNGALPTEPLEISHENGACVIHAVYQVVLGTPADE